MSRKLVIKGGKLLDIYSGLRYNNKDILVEDGVVKKIYENIEEAGAEYLNLNGEIITAGFIDMHTHVYRGSTYLGIDPDIIGISTGTTTVFDAGSSGASNFEDFRAKVIEKSKTRVISLLNASSNGLANGNGELRDIKNIDFEAVKEIVEKNRAIIKGIKARASASVVGELGITPIARAKEIASKLELPLVVHIGNYPPGIEEVLSLMEKGDVITHCFHGKPNGLLKEDGTIKEETIRAIERGVIFDVGHGTSSFNFNTARKAMNQGFYPNIISTDIYMQNYQGPVYSLAVTMSKMLNLGLSFEECVTKVTTAPMQNFKLEKIGAIKEGYCADFTIVNLKEASSEYIDSDGNRLEGKKNIEVVYVVRQGMLKKIGQ
jgi:dihydroorotase